jgi:DDE_Tnp_1-associated
MAVCVMLCRMNGFSDIEDFCDLQIDWLRKWIKMPNAVPRAQTFSNIFAIIEPDLFNRRRAMLDLTYRDSLLSLA